VDAEPSTEFSDALLARLRSEFEVETADGGFDSPRHEIPEEVVVTLTPIEEREAHGEPDEPRPARRRWWVPVAAAAAVAAIIAAGVVATSDGDERNIDVIEGPTGVPPTPERLAGIWYEDRNTGSYPEPIMATFGTDGTFTIGGVVDGEYWNTGTYRTEGHTIVLTVTGGRCNAETEWTWDATIMAGGRLEAQSARTGGPSPTDLGDCDMPVGEPFDMTRVWPTSPAARDMTPSYILAEGPITPATTNVADLQGYWLDAESGSLLRIDDTGGYRIDDRGALATNPAGVGRVEVGAETLTFTTAADAAGCTEGDVMVWSNARLDAGTLRATVTQDSCGRLLGTEVAFIYLQVDLP
jgi:hypothetical protein